MDTIVALSSGAPPSGVSIIRCSGPDSAKLLHQTVEGIVEPKNAVLKTLRDLEGEIIDQALVLWFPKPASFTGEDVVEFHVHGSRAVVDKLLSHATSFTNVRFAEPGEFASRAFANGKIDLTEAEGLADLIEAETEAQRKIAQYLASGGLKKKYDDWQRKILDARAMIEADIDFADEDDVPSSIAGTVWQEMSVLVSELKTHLQTYDRSEKIRNGVRVSLVGKPNVGKSSLLNALTGYDRAIVSESPGTTRDVVEVRLNLGGYLVLMSDTAGVRNNADPIEMDGIRRALLTAQDSDLVLYLSDDGEWDGLAISDNVDLIKVKSKSDLSTDPLKSEEIWQVSVRDESQISEFLTNLTKKVLHLASGSDAVGGIKTRYLDHLDSTINALQVALEPEIPLEIRAENLRVAAFNLGRITGQYDTEDVLGRIFSSFCIGK